MGRGRGAILFIGMIVTVAGIRAQIAGSPLGWRLTALGAVLGALSAFFTDFAATVAEANR